jgi:hypothetical protein
MRSIELIYQHTYILISLLIFNCSMICECLNNREKVQIRDENDPHHL